MSNMVTLGGVPQKVGEYRGLKVNILKDAPLTASAYSTRIVDLPVDTPSLINRDTEIKNLKKNLKVRGGFDGHMWQPPRAGRIKDTGEIFIFDGDHSKHLFRLSYPDAKTMPVQVIEVDTKQDIHNLFVQTNKTCKTSITAEQTFVHSVHAGDEKAMKYVKILDDAGMYVYCSHEDGGKVGRQDGIEIKFGHLKMATAQAQEPKIVTEAVNLILSCQNPIGPKNIVPGEMLRSLCLLFSCYPQLRPEGECGKEFESFFVETVGNKLPERYGRIVERDCRSGIPKTYRMAAGIAQDIVDFQKDHPGTFAAASKGAYNRIQVAALKKLAKSSITRARSRN